MTHNCLLFTKYFYGILSNYYVLQCTPRGIIANTFWEKGVCPRALGVWTDKADRGCGGINRGAETWFALKLGLTLLMPHSLSDPLATQFWCSIIPVHGKRLSKIQGRRLSPTNDRDLHLVPIYRNSYFRDNNSHSPLLHENRLVVFDPIFYFLSSATKKW